MNRQSDGLVFLMVFVALPALYMAYRSLPFFAFYALPFVATTWLVGHLWRVVCEARNISYRRGVALMTGTILILVVTIGFPQEMVFVGKDRAWIQSPYLYRAYNDFQHGIESNINSSWLGYFRQFLGRALPPVEYQPVPYDLRDLAWCLWLGVCFGAPAVFLFYGQKKDEERIRKVEEHALSKIAQIDKENFRLSKQNRDLRWDYSRDLKARDEEIKRLKNLAAALPASGGPPPPDGRSDPKPPGPSGIFDSDDF